jgi:hypothetical protein
MKKRENYTSMSSYRNSRIDFEHLQLQFFLVQDPEKMAAISVILTFYSLQILKMQELIIVHWR